MIFIIALLLSGISAFPVYIELSWLVKQNFVAENNFLNQWLHKVYNGVSAAQINFPFLFYGYDWLAFAHLMIAALFVGVYKNPVRNKFIIRWGIFALHLHSSACIYLWKH